MHPGVSEPDPPDHGREEARGASEHTPQTLRGDPGECWIRTVRRIVLVAAVLVSSVLVHSACSRKGGETDPSEAEGRSSSVPRLRIVASIAPLASLAARIAGPEAHVLTLIPAGASEHAWEPVPRVVEKVSRAQAFVQVGFGFDAWAVKLLEANAPGCVRIDASRGVDPVQESGEHAGAHPADPGSSAREEQRAQGSNPHYWLDPLSLEGGVRQLVEVLARLDPDRSAEYRSRGQQTCTDLEALDAEIRRRTAQFSSRKLLTFHDAWSYFARRYGLEIVGSIEQFPGKEPGTRHVVNVVRLAREQGVRAVFAEPQSPTKAAEVIAAECGIPMRLLDPLGGEAVPGRGDYFSLMRYNVDVMESVLR